MDFDDVLIAAGGFGRYQKWLLVLISAILSVPAAITIFTHIFISAVPKHQCHMPITTEMAARLREKLSPMEVSEKSNMSIQILECFTENISSAV